MSRGVGGVVWDLPPSGAELLKGAGGGGGLLSYMTPAVLSAQVGQVGERG